MTAFLKISERFPDSMKKTIALPAGVCYTDGMYTIQIRIAREYSLASGYIPMQFPSANALPTGDGTAREESEE